MPVAPDVQSLTTAAEEAAVGGDFASAEHYLRLAVDLQEAGAGSMPAELANTLNNLGVVYERLDKPVDAERCYRRAHAVARAVLDADHPFVAVSEQNLRDFCDGRGIAFDEAPATPAPPPAPIARTPPVPVPAAPAPVPMPPAPSVEPAGTSRTGALVLAGIAVLALTALAFIGIRSLGTSAQRDTPPVAAPTEATPAAAVAPPASAPTASEPTPPPAAAVVERAPVSPPPAIVRPAPAPERSARPAVVPTVVSAALCGTLETSGGDWQCGPAGSAPGTFFFYTRLAAPVATAVEHRWFRNGRLHQAVSLRVAANPQHGYRTYSRVAIGAERAGEWRTELRASDGAVLHEERFTVVP